MGSEGGSGLPARHSLAATAVIHGSTLSLSLSWLPAALDEAEVAALGRAWVDMLAGIAAHAGRPDAGGHTPSDFALLDLDQGQVEDLESAFAIDTTRDW